MVVRLGGFEGPSAPSATGGVTSPRPVKYTAIVSPICAGCAVVTSEKSGCSAAPWPIPPGGIVKTPGEVWFTNVVTIFDETPLLIT